MQKDALTYHLHAYALVLTTVRDWQPLHYGTASEKKEKMHLRK